MFEPAAVSLFVVVLACVAVDSKVFTPCELASAIEKVKNEYSQFHLLSIEDIPLAVCIAGYRRYDTKYKLTYENGTGYYGIFGAHSTDLSNCVSSGVWGRYNVSYILNEYFADETITTEQFRCLAHGIFSSTKAENYYRKLCSPPFVREVSCRSGPHAFITVWDPIQKDLFDRAFAQGEEPMNLLRTIFQTTATPTTSQRTSNLPENYTKESTEQTSTTQRLQILSEILNPSILESAINHLKFTLDFMIFACFLLTASTVLMSASKIVDLAIKYRTNRSRSVQRSHCDVEPEMINL